jgi:hypothetical protein
MTLGDNPTKTMAHSLASWFCSFGCHSSSHLVRQNISTAFKKLYCYAPGGKRLRTIVEFLAEILALNYRTILWMIAGTYQCWAVLTRTPWFSDWFSQGEPTGITKADNRFENQTHGSHPSETRHQTKWVPVIKFFLRQQGRLYERLGARVNQQPPMHQLAILSTGWVAFFHSAPDGVHLSPFLFAADHCTFFLVLGRFSLDLTSHIATLLTFLPS